MCNNKDDIRLTDTKSTKLDAERSKREDSIPEQARKEFRQFLDESFDRRMEIVEELQKERDAVL